jgi:hypothetical protein
MRQEAFTTTIAIVDGAPSPRFGKHFVRRAEH